MAHHVIEKDDWLSLLYFSIYLMMNIYTCVCENKTSVQYGVPSPSVDEYLRVTRQDCYDGNDADQNMIQLLRLQNNW